MNPIQKFVKGFNEQLNDRPALPAVNYPDGGGIGTEQDFGDYAEENMIEASRSRDAGKDPNEGHEKEPLRLINNGLDFLGNVGEEIDEWVERELGDGHTLRPKDALPGILRVFPAATKNWDAQRYSVDHSLQIARRNEERRMVRIINLGPDLVTIGSQTRMSGGVASGGITVPISKLDGTGPYTPVELNTQDEIWAAPTIAATPSIIEVLDFYGVPD
jgi:hypothetical protein